MSTVSILSILVYPQPGYLLVYYMGLSLVHCSYLSIGLLHNKTLPNSGGHLPTEVSPVFSLLMSIAMRTLQNLYHFIHLAKWIPTHPVPTVSNHRYMSYPYLCTLVPRAGAFKLLAAECYRHAEASKPIPLDSSRRADSNDALPASGGYLPAKVSAFFSLLTCIAMRTLRNLYYSIHLAKRIPTHPDPMLSDQRCMSYPYLCALVPGAGTFKLLATKCYRHVDASKPIPFNSPRRADSNDALPDSGRHLPTEVSASFSLLTSIAMRTLRDRYHSIPLRERIQMSHFPTLADIYPLRDLPFSPC